MPVIEGISADHIANARGGFEPQRRNNFQIVFPVAGRAVSMALHSCEWPRPSNDELVIDFGNEQRFVAGIAKYRAIVIQVKDFFRGPANEAIRGWRRQVYTPADGYVHLASAYKKDVRLQWAGPDASHIRQWLLIGCWPSECTPAEGAMGGSAQNLIVATLQLDKAYPV